MSEKDGQKSPTSSGTLPWVVLKFGGTSVSSRERWETIRKVLERRVRDGCRPLVVCSALSQVSNQLEKLLADAAAGSDVKAGLQRLRETHDRLGWELGVREKPAAWEEIFEDLERTLQGIALTTEVTPRLRARVLSTGELLSTHLGALWLREQGLKAAWQDAREILVAAREPLSPLGDDRQHLSATCSDAPDPEIDERLRKVDADVIVTQGFIAQGPDDDTVLLGRGGSDTSAAYLAAILSAERLEIWTDVPGIFTANPGQVPNARLLRRLGYAETEELASRGAKVLHPRCLGPVRRRGIPLHVCCTPWPDVQGTVISGDVKHTNRGILGVVARQNLVLVDMDLEGAWQQVGVIADVASCFQSLALSIDMLASSPNHITAVLDPAANSLEPAVLDALVESLSSLGSPRFDRPAACVSLVGTSVADVLHELGPLLENFEHEDVRLLSHAANDLSLTIVLGGQASDSLMLGLHAKLLRQWSQLELGPSWEELRSRNDGGSQ